MGWRSTATASPLAPSRRVSQRAVCDLPQPVRTAEIAMTGHRARSIVRRGPSSTKSAPAASAIEAWCMTAAWVTSL